MDTAAPPVMVKASVLSEKLRSSIGEGVESALLLTTSGALLSTASARHDFARSQECKMLSALVANMWRTYAQSANGAPCEPFDEQQQQNMMMMQNNGQQQQFGGNQQYGGGYSNNQQYGGNNNNMMNNNNNYSQNAMIQQQYSKQHRQQQSALHTDLELVLAELETTKLCCFGLGGRAVLALLASNQTELGLLKLKAASLQAELYDGLRLAMKNDFGSMLSS